MALEALQLTFNAAQRASNHAPEGSVRNVMTVLCHVFDYGSERKCVMEVKPVNSLYCCNCIIPFNFSPGAARDAPDAALGAGKSGKEQLREP